MSNTTRRKFLKFGSTWVAMTATAGSTLTQASRIFRESGRHSPIDTHPEMSGEVFVDGVPFWYDFSGDRFQNRGSHPPFPALGEWIGYGNPPPAPTESVDVVIVGGGLAGLCTAHLLRNENLLMIEHNRRVGGNAQAEQWGNLPYSLGGAYCIEPDEPLASLYDDLGLTKIVRITPGPPGPDPVEVDGQLIEGFWQGAGRPPEEQARFRQFLALVEEYGKNYPDIPLPATDFDWILELDRLTFRQAIEQRMGGPLPPLLDAAIEHYCWSSFAAGQDEISAAAGWNFLAAEQYGQWVFPGGTAQIAQRLWKRLVNGRRARFNLLGECVALDVRPNRDGVAVTYGLADGAVRAVQARRVVMACPKFVCKWIMPEYLRLDPKRANSMVTLEYRGYIVVNILVERGLGDSFYDAFLLEDGSLPGGPGAPSINDWHRPLDMVLAGFPLGGSTDREVLTLYWPLPYVTGRGFILGQQAFDHVTERLIEHLDEILTPVGVQRSQIRQVRLTRWGHALPISAPGFIADGHARRVREPIDGRVFFVNQDNWALPAVETSLLEAFAWAPEINR